MTDQSDKPCEIRGITVEEKAHSTLLRMHAVQGRLQVQSHFVLSESVEKSNVNNPRWSTGSFGGRTV